jgi:hypothetical protein
MRHILVDTLGLLLNVVVLPADMQDRDGAFFTAGQAGRLFPFIERIFADGGYADARWRRRCGIQVPGYCKSSSDRTLLDLRCCPNGGSSNERSHSRNRRQARDFERYATTVAAFFRLAMIRVLLRPLAANASP